MSPPTFTLTLHGTEKRVINVNYQKNISVDGNLTEIGKHTVVFSGRADLSGPDSDVLAKIARDQDDHLLVMYAGEFVVGPLWEKVNQFVFIRRFWISKFERR